VATGAFGASALERAGSVRALTSTVGERNLPQYDNCQPIAVYKYLLSISAKKAEERSMEIRFMQLDFISHPVFQHGFDWFKFDRLVRTHHAVVIHH
jgi:hypothetical protein